SLSRQAVRTVADRSGGRCQGALADRLLRGECASRARPFRPARALRGRSVRLSHAQGNGSQDLPRLLEADRRQAGGTGMGRRQVLRARSLWLRLLHLGNPPRAADGGAQALHRVQGPHAQASRRQTRGGGREDQGLIARVRRLVRCVTCFTLGPAHALYGGDVTERSVMVVGLLPPAPGPSWAFPPSTGPRWLPPAGPFSV